MKRLQTIFLAHCVFLFSHVHALDQLQVKLQKMDISVQPIDDPFTIYVQAEKSGNLVTLSIPPMYQEFPCSLRSPNFDVADYPALPDDYPLGGYIDTVANRIPRKFRPTSGLPVSFYVAGSNSHEPSYIGYVDRHGRIQFSAPNNSPIEKGSFITYPTNVSYLIADKPDIDVHSFPIAVGLSDASRWNPIDFPADGHQRSSIAFDFGFYDDIKNGFANGILYATWADNSSDLAFNTVNQPFKAYALARVDVWKNGTEHKVSQITNLSREIGGEVLPIDYTYANGSVAIDPINEDCIVVCYQQKKDSNIGFVMSRSFDGAVTWTKMLLGLENPHHPGQPLLDEVPIGGTDVHIGFDRFGGLWVNYMAEDPAADPIGGTSNYLIYSSDRGESFTLILKQKALKTSEMHSQFTPFYNGIKHSSLGIGPDATNLGCDSIWIGVDDTLNGCNNKLQLRIWGIRARGLGIHNIDYDSHHHAPLKKYTVPSGNAAGFSVLDVTPDGTVVVGVTEVQPIGTYIDLEKDNAKIWLNILPEGLGSNAFLERREIALTAGGDCLCFDPSPHACAAMEENCKIAVDKSGIHRGRIYVAFLDRAEIDTQIVKPFLTWSDDKGLSWSPPVRVSDDDSPKTDILHNLAVDSVTGVVAVTWADSRDSIDNTKVRRVGVFLSPDTLID